MKQVLQRRGSCQREEISPARELDRRLRESKTAATVAIDERVGHPRADERITEHHRLEYARSWTTGIHPATEMHRESLMIT